MNHYQRLKDLREDNELKEKDIAKLLGTTQQQISKYENGTQKMSILHYIKLAKFYNVSIDYIAGITDTPRTLDGSVYSVKNINNGGKQNVTTINGNNHKITIK